MHDAERLSVSNMSITCYCLVRMFAMRPTSGQDVTVPAQVPTSHQQQERHFSKLFAGLIYLCDRLDWQLSFRPFLLL
jgi:hypothetical protein